MWLAEGRSLRALPQWPERTAKPMKAATRVVGNRLGGWAAHTDLSAKEAKLSARKNNDQKSRTGLSKRNSACAQLLFFGLSAETILFLSLWAGFHIKSLISGFVPAQHNACLHSWSGWDSQETTSKGRNEPWEMSSAGASREGAPAEAQAVGLQPHCRGLIPELCQAQSWGNNGLKSLQ